MGNYERYFGISLTRHHNITTGKVYNRVIQKERKGDYLGKTVQVVPHVTNEIIEQIQYASWIKSDTNEKDNQICLIELGGTVGDIESSPFQEALRQLYLDVGRVDRLFISNFLERWNLIKVVESLLSWSPRPFNVRTDFFLIIYKDLPIIVFFDS